jgi:Domain of unknown function (DUF4158)
MINLTPEQAKKACEFSLSDLQQIQNCRGESNQLGFSYQLAVVKISNRFPTQDFKDIDENLLLELSNRLSLNKEYILEYSSQVVASRHKKEIIQHLQLSNFSTKVQELLACELKSQSNFNLSIPALVAKSEEWLIAKKVLSPTKEQIERLVRSIVVQAEDQIKSLIYSQLTDEIKVKIDLLLTTDQFARSQLQDIKTSAGRATIGSEIKIQEKLDLI